jgi:hypothetical protein
VVDRDLYLKVREDIGMLIYLEDRQRTKKSHIFNPDNVYLHPCSLLMATPPPRNHFILPTTTLIPTTLYLTTINTHTRLMFPSMAFKISQPAKGNVADFTGGV